MKINITDSADKKYYNEFYWILLNYDFLHEEPKSRVHFATTRPLVYAIVSVAMILIFVISFLINHHIEHTGLNFFTAVNVSDLCSQYHSLSLLCDSRERHRLLRHSLRFSFVGYFSM